jgi:tmRNA-binding protein
MAALTLNHLMTDLKAKGKTITLNKLAFRNYEVLETLEVGIALKGTEVKRYVNTILIGAFESSYCDQSNP